MSLVNISLLIQFLKDLLNLFFMFFIRRADKAVVRGVHQIPDTFDLRRNIVNKFFWRNACFFCLQFYFLAMFVRSGLEPHIITLISFISHDCIGEYNFIRISNMRFSRCVSNGGCQIIWFLCHL